MEQKPSGCIVAARSAVVLLLLLLPHSSGCCYCCCHPAAAAAAAAVTAAADLQDVSDASPQQHALIRLRHNRANEQAIVHLQSVSPSACLGVCCGAAPATPVIAQLMQL
jgi:7-keto-8-aminopelargonate synthetase-like enzyme